MDTTIVNIARPMQLAALAVLLIMIILLGMKIMGQGSRGFSSAILEVGVLLIAAWIIIRPNDAAGMLTKAVGGVQTPAAITGVPSAPTGGGPPGQ